MNLIWAQVVITMMKASIFSLILSTQLFPLIIERIWQKFNALRINFKANSFLMARLWILNKLEVQITFKILSLLKIQLNKFLNLIFNYRKWKLNLSKIKFPFNKSMSLSMIIKLKKTNNLKIIVSLFRATMMMK